MSQAKLEAIPMTLKKAQRYVKGRHRHVPLIQGGLFALGVGVVGGELCGVAIVARPARKLQDGRTCCIARVCTDGTPNACSFLYGLCRRIAQAMGYKRTLTYTRDDEPGTSLFAAGFAQDGETEGGSWSREGRERESVNTGRKVRWRA